MAARNSSKVRFTATFVSKVVRGTITGEFADTESPLRIRSTSTGAQYRVQKKLNGKVVKFTFSDADGRVVKDAAATIKLSEARAWARGVVADAARGKAPVRKAAATPAGIAVAEYGANLLKAYAKAATPSSTTAREYGLRYINDLFGATPVSEVGPAEARAVKDWDSTPAKRTRAWVAGKWLMAAAVDAELATGNPFAATKPPARPKPRSRYPKLDDLAAVERACIAEGSTGAEVARFILRQPLRRTAAATLRWREVDLDIGMLRLEGGHGRKSTEATELPMSPLAVEFLRGRLPADADPDDFVFGGRTIHWGGVLKRLQENAGFAWSPHDLRRSAVSLVAEYRPDISESSLDRWLGHASEGTRTAAGRAYQHAAGIRGMRRVAAAWSGILECALDGRADEVRAAADRYAEAA